MSNDLKREADGGFGVALGSPTDAMILDWLEQNARPDWRFGNEIHFSARCLSLYSFEKRPTVREAVSAVIKSGNASSSPTAADGSGGAERKHGN